MSTKFDDQLNKYKNIKIIVYILIISLAIIGFSNVVSSFKSIYDFFNNIFNPPEYVLAKDDLITKTLDLSKNLMDFAYMREINSPFNNFKNSSKDAIMKLHDESVKYSRETEKIFLTEYYPKITFISKEFKKHNIIPDDSFQWQLESVSSSFQIKDIAVTLINMSQELKSKMPKSTKQ